MWGKEASEPESYAMGMANGGPMRRRMMAIPPSHESRRWRHGEALIAVDARAVTR
jgi:hypothetical protein